MAEKIQLKKTTPAEVVLTLLMVGWVSAALLGGLHLVGIMELPKSAVPYIGAALVGYVFVGGVIITHLCVKFILKKGE